MLGDHLGDRSQALTRALTKANVRAWRALEIALAGESIWNVFDRAAVQAVRKWKYNPKIVDGKAVERSGMKIRLDFEMES